MRDDLPVVPKKLKPKKTTKNPTKKSINITDQESNPEKITSSTSENKALSEELTAEQIKNLCINENFRYLNTNKKVGHAVLINNQEGEKIALQFKMPEANGESVPSFRPVENIEEISRFGLAW